MIYFICGKIASGKSTLAKKLAQNPGTVLFSEDQWLSNIYPNEINTLEDYAKYSLRLRAAIAPLIVGLLEAGVSVVMDFPANTISQRAWLKSLVEHSGAEHELHYLEASDEVCKARLKMRNESGEHQYQTTLEQFDLFTSHFVPPTKDEGFNLIVTSQN